MQRATRATWAKRVERWKDSGLSASQFAVEIGVNPRTLMFWKWQLARESGGKPARKRATRTKPQSVEFVEVRPARAVAVADPRIEIAIGDRLVLRVPVGFDEETLERVVRVVERRR